jgi:hypothetical protein
MKDTKSSKRSDSARLGTLGWIGVGVLFCFTGMTCDHMAGKFPNGD